MKTTEHIVPGVIVDGENIIRRDLFVRITKSSWGILLSISYDEKIRLQIQLDHPNILQRLQEVLKK